MPFIKVDPKHQIAQRGNANHCPIAYAIAEQMPDARHIKVCPANKPDRILLSLNDERYEFPVTDRVQKYVQTWDRNGTPGRIEFVLDFGKATIRPRASRPATVVASAKTTSSGPKKPRKRNAIRVP